MSDLGPRPPDDTTEAAIMATLLFVLIIMLALVGWGIIQWHTLYSHSPSQFAASTEPSGLE